MTTCECNPRFTCRHCCENAKPYFFTPTPARGQFEREAQAWRALSIWLECREGDINGGDLVEFLGELAEFVEKGLDD